jgi:hypothetical protein
MLLATINSSIILIALDIFRRIHLDPVTPANTNYLLRTTACLLVGCTRVLSPDSKGRGPNLLTAETITRCDMRRE